MAKDETTKTEKEVIHWVIRDSDGEAFGVVITPNYIGYRGVTINGTRYDFDRISKAEFETYREFDVPLYNLNPAGEATD